MRQAVTFKPVVVVALALALSAAAAFAQQPGRGQQRGPEGGRMQGMADLRYVEVAWMAACFELNASVQQLTALLPTFRAAYKLREETMEKARESRDFSALETAGRRIRAGIDSKFKEVLTPQQMAQWQRLQQEAEARRQAGARGPGGGGGPR